MKKSWQKELYYKGHLDCLYFYSKHIKEIKKFLKNQEIASKIHIENGNYAGVFLRRGSKDEPLFIKEFTKKALNRKFFDLRTKTKRQEAIQNKLLTPIQEKLWLYFPPNKPIEFFYATNSEHPNKPIERIFIDVDRTNLSEKIAKKVVLSLIQEIKNDKPFNKIFKNKIKVLFTGSSYHVYVILKKPISYDLYKDYIAYGRDKQISFISKWTLQVNKKTKIPVTRGHEKINNAIILDISGTPSGKLARVPFSVHVKDGKIDGVAELIKI
jgi:hypothetical protein